MWEGSHLSRLRGRGAAEHLFHFSIALQQPFASLIDLLNPDDVDIGSDPILTTDKQLA